MIEQDAPVQSSRNLPADLEPGELSNGGSVGYGAEVGNVVQIIGRLGVGGAEMHFVNLINNLSAAKRTAILISADIGGASLADKLGDGVDLVEFPVRKRSAIIDVFRLAKLMKELRCEVVHTHMFWPSLFGSVAARIARVPVIVTTEHGENHWKKYVHRWLEKHVISRFSSRRFCVSRTILERRRDLDGVPSSKLRLIANGTSVPAVPTELWKNEEVVIGSLGRFVKQKDYLQFVRVIADLNGRGHRVRGCIVGDGPEMSAIRLCVKELGVVGQVELPGMDTDTDRWFRYFDIYGVTSSEEGLPVAMLEAMSYGLPIVATDVGAISSVVRNEVEGLIVESKDTNLFSTAVERLLMHKKDAEKYGRAARQRIVTKYSIRQIAEMYERDYQELLAVRSE